MASPSCDDARLTETFQLSGIVYLWSTRVHRSYFKVLTGSW